MRSGGRENNQKLLNSFGKVFPAKIISFHSFYAKLEQRFSAKQQNLRSVYASPDSSGKWDLNNDSELSIFQVERFNGLIFGKFSQVSLRDV